MDNATAIPSRMATSAPLQDPEHVPLSGNAEPVEVADKHLLLQLEVFQLARRASDDLKSVVTAINGVPTSVADSVRSSKAFSHELAATRLTSAIIRQLPRGSGSRISNATTQAVEAAAQSIIRDIATVVREQFIHTIDELGRGAPLVGRHRGVYDSEDGLAADILGDSAPIDRVTDRLLKSLTPVDTMWRLVIDRWHEAYLPPLLSHIGIDPVITSGTQQGLATLIDGALTEALKPDVERLLQELHIAATVRQRIGPPVDALFRTLSLYRRASEARTAEVTTQVQQSLQPRIDGIQNQINVNVVTLREVEKKTEAVKKETEHLQHELKFGPISLKMQSSIATFLGAAALLVALGLAVAYFGIGGTGGGDSDELSQQMKSLRKEVAALHKQVDTSSSEVSELKASTQSGYEATYGLLQRVESLEARGARQ